MNKSTSFAWAGWILALLLLALNGWSLYQLLDEGITQTYMEQYNREQGEALADLVSFANSLEEKPSRDAVAQWLGVSLSEGVATIGNLEYHFNDSGELSHIRVAVPHFNELRQGRE